MQSHQEAGGGAGTTKGRCGIARDEMLEDRLQGHYPERFVQGLTNLRNVELEDVLEDLLGHAAAGLDGSFGPRLPQDHSPEVGCRYFAQALQDRTGNLAAGPGTAGRDRDGCQRDGVGVHLGRGRNLLAQTDHADELAPLVVEHRRGQVDDDVAAGRRTNQRPVDDAPTPVAGGHRGGDPIARQGAPVGLELLDHLLYGTANHFLRPKAIEALRRGIHGRDESSCARGNDGLVHLRQDNPAGPHQVFQAGPRRRLAAHRLAQICAADGRSRVAAELFESQRVELQVLFGGR